MNPVSAECRARLLAGEVHVRYLTLDELTPARLQIALEQLPPDERARARRMVRRTTQQQFVAARLLLRETLARYFAIAPSSILLRYEEHGRPVIDAPATLTTLGFSLSHTEGLVACAVAYGEVVGVDVERDDIGRNTYQLEPECLHPDERDALECLARDARRRAFFSLWTLKEAYSKALGIGLALPFARVRMLPDADGEVRRPLLEDGAPGQSWTLKVWAIGAGHCLAIAAPGTNRIIRLHPTQLSGASCLEWSRRWTARTTTSSSVAVDWRA